MAATRRPRPRRPARDAVARADGVRIVLSTAPPRVAARLARRLVDAGAAVCVNLVPGVRSVYRWRGDVASDRETLLVVKTRAASVRRCLAALAAAHPYEVPEGLVLRPDAGLAAYLAWVDTEGR